MKTILVIPPYYLLDPPVKEDNNKNPNNKLQTTPLLMPYFPLFLKPSSFLFLDFEILISGEPRTLSSCLEIIIAQKPQKLIFNLSQGKYFEDYNINMQNIIEKIKINHPEIKIELLKKENCGGYREENQKKIEEIIKYTKRNSQKLMVAQDLMCLRNINKILNSEIYDFWFYNFQKSAIKEIIKLKKDYFDLCFYLTCDFEEISFEEIDLLKENGLEKLFLEIKIDCEFLTCFEKHLEKIKKISKLCKLRVKAIPNLSQINNIGIIEFLNHLEEEKIEYSIKHNTKKIETKKEFANFGTLSLISALEKKDEIAKRLKETLIIREKTTFEQIIDFLLRTENKYLEFYIDIVHFLDGFFTKEEIIEYLKKLHPKSKKENLQKIVYECINLLEKEMFIDYLDSKTQNLPKINNCSHYVSVFPRLNNLFLMYSGSEKGYIFGKNTSVIEEVPKDIFFFFVFSKGIFVLKEVANKLHLLFKDTKEFSKENYLKTTKKIYNTLKHYGLCK